MTWLSKFIEWLSKQIGLVAPDRREVRVEESPELNVEMQEELKVLRNRAYTWRNRAQMARQQNNEDLVQQALERMWQCQVKAAELQGKSHPPRPDEIPSDLDMGDDADPGIDNKGHPPWRPYDPSRVPKKPLPSSGGGEVALPLPKEDADL